MEMGGGWVLELDIESFFDSVDRGQLRQVLNQRVRDGVLLRLIGKWLNAGVMEAGQVYHPEAGTPQGGVISPLLANIFLHEVLDVWWANEVRPRLRGRASMVRYADDAVLLFEHEDDARKVLSVLPKRFGKYGLRLSPREDPTGPVPAPAGRISSAGGSSRNLRPAGLHAATPGGDPEASSLFRDNRRTRGQREHQETGGLQSEDREGCDQAEPLRDRADGDRQGQVERLEEAAHHRHQQ